MNIDDIYSLENIERSRALARSYRSMVEAGKLPHEYLKVADRIEAHADEREVSEYYWVGPALGHAGLTG